MVLLWYEGGCVFSGVSVFWVDGFLVGLVFVGVVGIGSKDGVGIRL